MQSSKKKQYRLPLLSIHRQHFLIKKYYIDSVYRATLTISVKKITTLTDSFYTDSHLKPALLTRCETLLLGIQAVEVVSLTM
jgi:hypothetical protein